MRTPMADHMRTRILSILAETDMFKALPIEVLEKVALKIKRLLLDKGHILYHKNDTADALYIIASGQIGLYPTDPSTRQAPMAVLGHSQILGELSILTNEPRHVTARLEATSELLSLSKDDFNELLRNNPIMGMHLSTTLSERLASTTREAHAGLAAAKKTGSKIFLFINLLDESHSMLFYPNLAIALLEQTRKKTALIDLSRGHRPHISRTLGIEKESIGARAAIGLSASELIERIRSTHPSGLDLLTLPAELLAGTRDKTKTIATLNHLRVLYEYCIICATPLRWDSLQPLLKEADETFLVATDKATIETQVYSKIGLIKTDKNPWAPSREVILQDDGKDSFVGHSDIRIGWSKNISRSLDKSASPFSALASTKTQRSIERLARILGDIKLGIALGSGGARGYTIVGILKILEREHIYPDIISGTSIGAIIGALYAKGMTIDEILGIGATIDKNWVRDILFWDLTLPKDGGFLSGRKLQRFFKSLFDDLEFKDLELPFACIATDIKTGEEVTFNDGRVLDAVRASVSIPIIWKPYLYRGRYLVDGGLVNPVPTSTLLSMGADTILSVSLTSSPALRKFMMAGKPQTTATPGMLPVFFHMISTMMHEVAVNKAQIAQVTVAPRITDYNWTDFDKVDELVAIGETAAEEALPQIKSILPYFSNYCTTKLRH